MSPRYLHINKVVFFESNIKRIGNYIQPQARIAINNALASLIFKRRYQEFFFVNAL